MDVSLPDWERDDGGVEGPESGPDALPVARRAHRLLPIQKMERGRFHIFLARNEQKKQTCAGLWPFVRRRVARASTRRPTDPEME